MSSFLSKHIVCLFLIVDLSNTFFLRPHEHQNAFRVRRNIRNRTSCILPEQPDNGVWHFLERDDKAKITLEFGCNAGYKISSNFHYMVCTPYGWIPPVPRTCLKICPPLISTNQMDVICKNKGVEVRCDEATDNTTASFECAPYFEPVDSTIGNRFCWKGKWNESPPFCQPVCGKKRVSALPLIVHGIKVEKGDYPWSTAIFLVGDVKITNVCGGTMLTQKVILTAAHCVADEHGRSIPKEEILVGVGKYYNKYKDPRDTGAQYSNVSKVVAHENYRGDIQQYASDIALLITQDELLLSKVVQPVCYQGLPKFRFGEKFKGVVTAWGFTMPNSNPSEELLEISMSFSPSSVCLRELPEEFADRYVTYDKFCAGSTNNGSAICKGDSGASLTFRSSENGRYYVRGVVSVSNSVGVDGGCDVVGKTLFTDVVKHYEWIREIILKYDRNIIRIL